jgi:Rrf2 family protein
MRLSKKAEYGLRALAAMAQGKRIWGIQELSEQENIPVKFLEQILLSLRHAGVLASRRGVGGGYSLVRLPGETTLAEVIRALDGPIEPVPCASDNPTVPCTCPDRSTCPVRQLMGLFRSQVVGWLESHTLEDLARLSSGSASLAFEI